MSNLFMKVIHGLRKQNQSIYTLYMRGLLYITLATACTTSQKSWHIWHLVAERLQSSSTWFALGTFFIRWIKSAMCHEMCHSAENLKSLWQVPFTLYFAAQTRARNSSSKKSPDPSENGPFNIHVGTSHYVTHIYPLWQPCLAAVSQRQLSLDLAWASWCRRWNLPSRRSDAVRYHMNGCKNWCKSMQIYANV